MRQLNSAIKTLLQATVVFGSLFSAVASANDVEIVEATIEAAGENRYRINVTLLHGDTGWDHYADRWDVLNEKGELLGSRTLAHPHVNEQPFTRSLTLDIPDGVSSVTIVASDSVHGDSEKTLTIAVT